jgi:hypothetical protein
MGKICTKKDDLNSIKSLLLLWYLNLVSVLIFSVISFALRDKAEDIVILFILHGSGLLNSFFICIILRQQIKISKEHTPNTLTPPWNTHTEDILPAYIP